MSTFTHRLRFAPAIVTVTKHARTPWAVNADARPRQLPNLILTRGARRLAFLGGEEELVILKGDISHKEFWLVNLKTGRERQLTNLGREFDIGDFDVSADGREIIFDRAREESDVVLFELPDR